jgi:uncharacterized protein YlzI (FlbEa/FlbD family)
LKRLTGRSAVIFAASILVFGASTAFADDVITMKDGKKYTGGILFHTETQYCISVNGKAERLNISDIKKIEFDSAHNGTRAK